MAVVALVTLVASCASQLPPEAPHVPDYTGFYKDICERRGACGALLMTAQGIGDGREAMRILTRYTFTDGIANDTAVNDAVDALGIAVVSGRKWERATAARRLLDLIGVDSPGYQWRE